MHKIEFDKVMREAEAACAKSGTRFTEKRRNVLSVLLDSELPLSAYEVTSRLETANGTSMPPMSVYRILDFLVSENLVHKLNSEGKYLACAHIACAHPHEIPQFLICDRCHQVKEANIHLNVIADLRDNVSSNGFALIDPQLELHCICNKCATA